MTVEPFTREWHVANIDRLIGELTGELLAWDERDREAPYAAKSIAARITNIARALSAETHAIGTLDYIEHARRTESLPSEHGTAHRRDPSA